jgi:aarF domain-containing kinase
VHAGNLLVLPDGRVGFIDFGIVGRISPVTWRAIEALLLATGAADYDTMARALVTIGAASGEVDIKVGAGRGGKPDGRSSGAAAPVLLLGL